MNYNIKEKETPFTSFYTNCTLWEGQSSKYSWNDNSASKNYRWWLLMWYVVRAL